MAEMDRILFGDNQFFGVNHFSEEKARQQLARFKDTAAIVEVLDAAYDMGIRTIRVPIFRNQTFYRGLEFSLTQAVVREIEAKTPYKVVGEGCSADTELTGNIVNYAKAILNRTQLNEVREAAS